MNVGIVDLVATCRRERARTMSLFEHVGGWVTSTSDPALQRLFATAAHRHAWHAELWQDRTPTIPGVEEISPDITIGHALDGREGDDARARAYADALAEMLAELGALRERIDDDLDPATVRVIDLVASDAQASAAALRVHRNDNERSFRNDTK